MSIRIDNVRLAFPALYKPKAFAGGTEDSAKYGATLLILKSDAATLKAVKDAMLAAAIKRWDKTGQKTYDTLVAQDRVCLRDGDMKEAYDGFEGAMYISASNAAKPICIGKDRAPLSEDSGLPYAGCYVNASIEIWAQDNKYGKRINATLRGVQFAKDGDAFSGSAPATTDEFDDVAAQGGADDLL
jgi:hypothetical protein